MFHWPDTTVLITGASSGFGWAAARRFHALGAKVVATGRRTERLKSLQRELGERLLPLPFDLRDSKATQEAVEGLPLDFTPNILINNSGLALGLEPAQRAKLEDWQTMMDTNIGGLVTLTHALLPGMVGRGQGHIINISSIAGTWPYPGGNIYGATKAFVSQFSRNLRCDLLGTGVRVTTIEPGLCETEFSLVRFQGDEQAAKLPYQGIEALSAEDIAEAMVWVASQPRHVNVNSVEIMATEQAWGPFAFHREEGPAATKTGCK